MFENIHILKFSYESDLCLFMFLFLWHFLQHCKKKKRIGRRKTGEKKGIMLFKLHFLTLAYQFFKITIIDKQWYYIREKK